MRGFGVRIGILVVVLVIGFVVRQYFARNAGELAVGDCFDEPAIATEAIDNVKPHACTDLHDAEVFFVGSFEPASETFPTDEQFDDFIFDRCAGAFTAYTGLDLTTDTDLTAGAFTPTSDSWRGGNHKVTCYAKKGDSTQLNASVRKAS
jgi:hypothetical protein